MIKAAFYFSCKGMREAEEITIREAGGAPPVSQHCYSSKKMYQRPKYIFAVIERDNDEIILDHVDHI